MNISRRRILEGIGATAISAITPLRGPSIVRSSLLGSHNPVREENSRPGQAYQLVRPAQAGRLESYLSRSSVAGGETVQLYVHSVHKRLYAQIFRLGEYEGLLARAVTRRVELHPQIQPMLAPSPEGLVECAWVPTWEISIPRKWVSGKYLIKITGVHGSGYAEDRFEQLIVRDDSQPADFLYIVPVFTDAAYNPWSPLGQRARSLYDFAFSGTERAHEVSLNRPMSASLDPLSSFGLGAGNHFSNTVGQALPNYRVSNVGWEYPLHRWLEAGGYHIAYITDEDLHVYDVTDLLRYKGIILAGHSEYYSLAMRQNLQSAVKAGVSLLVAGADAMQWHVGFDPVSRVITCYKGDPEPSPLPEGYATSQWQFLNDDHGNTLHQGSFLGATYSGSWQASGRMRASNTYHWAWATAGVKEGGLLSHIIGHEVDTVWSSATGVTILANSPRGDGGNSQMTIRDLDSTFIWCSGSLQFSWGLLHRNTPPWAPIGQDFYHSAVEILMRNLMNRVIQI